MGYRIKGARIAMIPVEPEVLGVIGLVYLWGFNCDRY
jgi:hypothetical protein